MEKKISVKNSEKLSLVYESKVFLSVYIKIVITLTILR